MIEHTECSHCGKDFKSELELSHDVPCYLFCLQAGDRQDREYFANKYNRRYLCNKCHKKYELQLQAFFILKAIDFSKQYFGDK